MKFLKLTKLKRLIVLVATIVAATLAIILGSTYYVSKDPRKSIEYGGGAEYVVQIQANSGDSKSIATDVAQSIYERINPLGVNGASAESEITDKGANVRVTYPGTTTEEQRKEIERLITEQPQLVLTDVYGNPLFTEQGRFNEALDKDPNGFIGFKNQTMKIEDFYKYNTDVDGKLLPLQTRTPIISGGAAAVLQNNQRVVKITLEGDKVTDWTNATKYISSLPEGKRTIQAWLNPQVFIHEMQRVYTSSTTPSWDAVWQDVSSNKQTLYNLAHYAYNVDLAKRTRLITEVANAEDYLISSATVSGPLNGREFNIEGKFSADEAQKLARRINYGVSDFSLKTLYSKTVEAGYGSSAFNKALIAGIVVFSVIALILMVNYGLLGALSTISIALFIFMTLLMFTVMRGEYSPAAIAALIIGIGMSVDANIITFERLKSEMYAGSSLGKAFATSNKKSFSTIFDSNITTMIVAIVLFYFGTRSIVGLSVTLIISIVFTLVVMLLFTKFTSTLLVKSGAFENKKWLVGLKPNFDPKVQARINKFDYIKNSKWFVLSSGLIMLAGIVMFSIFAAVHHSGASGLVLSQDFIGGTTINIQPISGSSFSQTDLENIQKVLSAHGINSDVSLSESLVSVSTKVQITDITSIKTDLVSSKYALDSIVDAKTLDVSNTTTDVAKSLVKDAVWAIVIAMGAIIVYTLIRFKWTYSIAALVALLHDAAIVLAFFAIARIEISPIFIAAILSVVGYSINDTIVTFDRIREKAANHIGVMDASAIKLLANDAIKDTLKRSLWTSLTTIIAIIILMAFGNATKFEFNIAMLIGLISGTYSSIFIATYLWTKLEMFRQKRIQARVKNNFWKTNGVQEQTVQGINDYQV